MQSLIQIIKVGELKDKTYEGRSYQTQEAECLLLNDDGSVECVGVLRLGEKFRGDNLPKLGVYQAHFSLVASPKDRRIGAVVTGLLPREVKPGRAAPAGQ